MKLGLGAVPSPKDIRDYRLKFNTWEEMPDTYYVVDKAMVKNQGEKPTCVAHALSEIIEYNYKNRTYILLIIIDRHLGKDLP